MRILFYVGYQDGLLSPSSDGIGGSESMVMLIASRLVDRGHQVVIAGDVVDGMMGGVVWCHTNNLTKMVDTRYDMVIAINYINYLLVLDRLIDFDQSIFWLHNTEHHRWHRGGVLDGNGDYLYDDPRMSLVVCVSEWQKGVISEKYPNAASKLRVIENGIDTVQFVNDCRGDIPYCDDRVFIYSSAGDRGLSTVLEMWPKVRAKYGDARLKICWPNYSSSITEQVLSDHCVVDGKNGIEVLGSLSKGELHREIVSSKYWLYPSDYLETSCITGIEMMYGKTVVISGNSGNLQSLLDNNAYLVDSNLPVDQMIDQCIDYIDLVEGLPVETVHADLDTVHERAVERYCIDGKADQWDKLISRIKVERIVDAIYVISLRADDLAVGERCRAQLDQAGITGYIKMWPAVDGSKVTDRQLQDDYQMRRYSAWKMEHSDNDWWNREMLPGELGCAISHWQVWDDANKNGFERILVLEDDFEAVGKVTQDMFNQLPIDWDMFYLGRNRLTEEVDDGKLVVKADRSYNLHSYMLSAAGIKKLLDQNFDKNLMPVDEFIQATYCSHQRDDLNRVIWRDSFAYGLSQGNDIFVQGNAGGKFAGMVSATEQIHLNGRKHSELYDYYRDKNQWIDRYLVRGIRVKAWDLVIDQPVPGVYCTPFFTPLFCQHVIEEAEHSGEWTVDRHQYYPTTDMLLSQIGLDDIYNEILREFVEPMMQHCYQLDGEDWKNTRNENFIARYSEDTQTQLGIHHDASYVTALVNLSQHGEDFEGGGTYFPRYEALYRPDRGSLSIHPGSLTHKHGARRVSKGRRYIITSFMSRR